MFQDPLLTSAHKLATATSTREADMASTLFSEREAEHLPNVVVGAELVMNVVEACALSERPLKADELKEYTRRNMRSAAEAIKAGLWLRLIEQKGSEFTAPSAVRSRFPAGKELKSLLFTDYLKQKKSFIQFTTFLDYGDSPTSASEKVKVLYKIDVSGQNILDQFGGWGKSAGMFEGTNRSLRLRPEFQVSDLPTEYLKELKDALDSDIRARIFVNRKLTEETFRIVPSAGIDRAVRAIRGIKVDPRNSVEDAGEVLEDYLRLKAKTDGIDVTGALGIGGVVKLLGDNIASEHRTIGEAINTLRVMSAHATRAVTERRWEIKSDSGLEIVLFSLSLVRSIDDYSRTKATVF